MVEPVSFSTSALLFPERRISSACLALRPKTTEQSSTRMIGSPPLPCVTFSWASLTTTYLQAPSRSVCRRSCNRVRPYNVPGIVRDHYPHNLSEREQNLLTEWERARTNAIPATGAA